MTKLATVWILRDTSTDLFFNRARLEPVPAVYTEGQAKRFKTKYNRKGIPATLNGRYTHLASCDLEIIECDLVKKENNG